jgi:hypothetical protein
MLQKLRTNRNLLMLNKKKSLDLTLNIIMFLILFTSLEINFTNTKNTKTFCTFYMVKDTIIYMDLISKLIVIFKMCQIVNKRQNFIY